MFKSKWQSSGEPYIRVGDPIGAAVGYDRMGILNAMIPRWIKESTPLMITMRDGVKLYGIITRSDPMQVGTGYVPNAFVLLSPDPAETGIDMDNAMDMYIRTEEIACIGVGTQYTADGDCGIFGGIAVHGEKDNSSKQ